MSNVDLGRIVGGITAGDTLANKQLLAIATTTGYNKTLDIWIPLALNGVTSFTCTGLVLDLRSPSGGFVPSGGFNAMTDSNITVSTLSVQENGIRIRLLNANAWANIVNNGFCGGTVTFSGSFS